MGRLAKCGGLGFVLAAAVVLGAYGYQRLVGQVAPAPLPAPDRLQPPISVLVLGGTGAVGTALLKELIASGSIGSVTSVSRRVHPR